MLTKKLISSIVIAIVLLSLVTTIVLADAASPQSPTPNAPLDCGVWAYTPTYNSSTGTVSGKGEISCVTSHPSLKVVTRLQDWTGRYVDVTKNCPNTNYCSSKATLTWSSGRQWKTVVSGYQGTDWQAGYDTGFGTYNIP